MKLNKRLCALTAILVLAAALLPIAAFAQAVPTEDTPVEDAAAQAEPSAPLTPDGNLTLVDDVGSSTGAGKQFVTFVTKGGNYFYLVIDRDDKGTETVHFLNLVDESDLLALMEDEEAAAYKEAHTAAESEPAATPTSAPTPDPEPAAEPEPEQEKSRLDPLLLLLPLALSGGGAGYYLMQKKKKEAEKQKPDPDADYSEDEGVDYGYGDSEASADKPFSDEETDDGASFDEQGF